VCLADCLSANKDTVQISTELSASFAVDNNVLTHSCTLDGQSYPWWVVDLGEELAVGSIQITLPSVNGANRNYRYLALLTSFINSLKYGKIH